MSEMSVCRLCLCKDNLSSIFEYEGMPGYVKECVSIEICENDSLPTTVCKTCINQVKNWSDFKETCMKSHQTLLESSQEDTKCKIVRIEDKNEEIQILNDWLKLEGELSCSDLDLDDNDEDVDLNDCEDKSEAFTKSDKAILYKCGLCEESFEYCFDYLDHQLVHEGKPVFKCDKCAEVFSNRKELVEHDVMHKIPCPKCGIKVMKKSMRLHLNKHTDRFKCKFCSLCTSSQSLIDQHIITKHTNIKNHICETCGKRFSSKTSLLVHSKSHSDVRDYQCKQCPYAGRTASALYIHMARHQLELQVCEVCSKTYKSVKTLKDHQRRVHPKSKNHTCSYCNKTFVDKYMLTVHLRTHTGVRPYLCRLCEKAFIRSDGLKEHMATHGERVWYDCKVCRKKFTTKKGVTRHHCPGVVQA